MSMLPYRQKQQPPQARCPDGLPAANTTRQGRVRRCTREEVRAPPRKRCPRSQGCSSRAWGREQAPDNACTASCRTEPVVEGLRGAGLGGASTAARHRCDAARGAARRPILQLLPSQMCRAARVDEPVSEGRHTTARSTCHEESAATTAMTGLRPSCR